MGNNGWILRYWRVQNDLVLKQIHLFAPAYAERIRPELFCLYLALANRMNLKESNPRWKDQLLNREVKNRLPLIF